MKRKIIITYRSLKRIFTFFKSMSWYEIEYVFTNQALMYDATHLPKPLKECKSPYREATLVPTKEILEMPNQPNDKELQSGFSAWDVGKDEINHDE